jgi:hypothetical protein
MNGALQAGFSMFGKRVHKYYRQLALSIGKENTPVPWSRKDGFPRLSGDRYFDGNGVNHGQDI